MKIETVDIPVPFGVEVLEIRPNILNIKVQKMSKKIVPILPTIIGEVGGEFKLIKQKLIPSRIEVTGPRDIVSDLKTISTSAIDISSLKNSGELKVATVDIDPRLSILSKESVFFHYEIRPRKANITLDRVRIRFLTSAKSIAPKVRRVSLDVLLPEGEDQTVKSSQVEVVADIPDGARGKVMVPLKAKLPEGVFLLKIHPAEVQVYVKP